MAALETLRLANFATGGAPLDCPAPKPPSRMLLACNGWNGPWGIGKLLEKEEV
jgi:hypothetical protein